MKKKKNPIPGWVYLVFKQKHQVLSSDLMAYMPWHCTHDAHLPVELKIQNIPQHCTQWSPACILAFSSFSFYGEFWNRDIVAMWHSSALVDSKTKYKAVRHRINIIQIFTLLSIPILCFICNNLTNLTNCNTSCNLFCVKTNW